jgi:F-type H+-transporting ATPase subunit b
MAYWKGRRAAWSVALLLGGALAVGAWSAAARELRGAPPGAVEAALRGAEPASGSGRAEEAEAHGGNGIASLVARLLNFGILVGALGYLLRRPFAAYLTTRGTAIRRDLAEAAALSQQAATQLAEIDAKLQALPEALAALRARGADEVAAEEARIRAATEAERQRLVDHARREIDLQVRIAREALLREAAELAVSVAAERVKERLTPEVHLHLIDRYAAQVGRLRGLAE